MASQPLDRTSPVPLYFQIAERLHAAIESGELQPGQRLDNEIELSDQLGVSRPTVRQAIQRLVQQGLLVRRRGIGTVVVQRRIRRPLGLTGLQEDLAAAGRNPSTTVLELSLVSVGPEMASSLLLESGATVLFIRRLRCADGMPLAVMENFLAPQLLDLPISADILEKQGLYEFLRSQGVQFHSAHQVIGARRASHAEARLLGTTRSSTVLTLARTAHDPTGRAIELGQHAYLATRYSFEMTVLSH
ncbi:MAG TPA: GntR family transcriptional regulator [Acidimicrobiales bacterium]|nr:GntR family transcriptional regulator [Acidimicrobiales bacterium]